MSDFTKAMISYAASLIIEFCILRIIVIPESFEEEFNEELKTEDEELITKAK